MSATVILVVAAAWLGIGLVLSLVLGRRGHDPFSWFLLGLMLGPFAIALAVDSWRHEKPPSARRAVAAAGADGGQTVDVLVGFDGSADSLAALSAAVDMLGTRLGRLTLATVIPYDGGLEAERDSRAALDRQARLMTGLTPSLEVVRGHPATALSAEAAAGGYELVAIGTRGAGRSHLFGSAASELARDCKVPVLLVGAA